MIIVIWGQSNQVLFYHWLCVLEQQLFDMWVCQWITSGIMYGQNEKEIDRFDHFLCVTKMVFGAWMNKMDQMIANGIYGFKEKMLCGRM